MNPTIILIIVCLVLLAILKAYLDSSSPKTTNRDFQGFFKRKRLLTKDEIKFFKLLEVILKGNYYIFPQVRIGSLVEVGTRTRNSYGKLNRINKKSVDFVIADKHTLSPIVAIELDDSTHGLVSRINRDIFVNELFKNVGIRLVRIPCQNEYDNNEIIAQLGLGFPVKNETKSIPSRS